MILQGIKISLPSLLRFHATWEQYIEMHSPTYQVTYCCLTLNSAQGEDDSYDDDLTKIDPLNEVCSQTTSFDA